jgi:hypothetical protein
VLNEDVSSWHDCLEEDKEGCTSSFYIMSNYNYVSDRCCNTKHLRKKITISSIKPIAARNEFIGYRAGYG